MIERFGPWTAHNIDLGHGVWTMSPDVVVIDESRATRVTQVVSDFARRDLSEQRALDLACYEGGFGIELARRGAEVVAMDAREEHVAKARFAKEVLGLERLEVRQDDVRNLSEDSYGVFDVILCVGILYHLEAADAFRLLETIARLTRRLAVIETVVALRSRTGVAHGGHQYRGRSYPEDPRQPGAAVGNLSSFLPTMPSLLNLLDDAGFTSVCEVRNPPLPPLDAYLDRVLLVAARGERLDVARLPVDPGRWPERVRRGAHPAQGLRWALLDRWERRRGRGLPTFFRQYPRS